MVRIINGWTEIKPGLFEKVINGKRLESAQFAPQMPETEIADVLKGQERRSRGWVALAWRTIAVWHRWRAS
jgi:hypothetical protein